MFIDSSQLVNDEIIAGDICIIGAGIAGLTIAKEFMNTNKSVVVVESGDLKPDANPNKLISGKNIGLPYYDINETRARAFGGTSHLWHVDINREITGVRLRGMDSIDFEEKEWIPNSGWPISKKELDPFYERAHELFKIGPYSYKYKDWVEQGDSSIHYHMQESNIHTTFFQFARKNVFYKDYYHDFKNADNIRVFLNSTVLIINTTESAGKVTSLSVLAHEEIKFSIEAKNYILAAGGLENPRLLLLSNRHAKNGLGNDHDLVGRFFMEHPHVWGYKNVGTYYPDDPKRFNKNTIYNLHHRNGIPVLGYLSLNEDVIRQNKLLNLTLGIRGKTRKHPTGSIEAIRAFRRILSCVKRRKFHENFKKQIEVVNSDWNKAIYETFRRLVNGDVEKWNRYGLVESGININLMAEQSPNPHSRVMLADRVDKFGQKKIALNWQLTELDLISMRKSLEIFNKEFQKKKLGKIDINLESGAPPKALKGGYHHMGTTRMHENPRYGVVDKNCRLHGTDNLYVAGSSVFPTCGYANPTLTIAALSVRLADYLKKSN